MDKRIITAEITEIFKLVNACFDVKALIKLIAAHKGYNRTVRELVEKAGFKLSPSYLFEDELDKAISKWGYMWGPQEKEDAESWIMEYMFFPKNLSKTKEKEEETWKEEDKKREEEFREKQKEKGIEVKEKEKKEEPKKPRRQITPFLVKFKKKVDEGTKKESDLEKEMTNAVFGLVKQYMRDVMKLKLEDKEDDLKETEIEKEEKQEDANEYTMFTEEYYDELEKHHAELHSVRDLVDVLAFENLRKSLQAYIDKVGTPAQKKVFNQILADPDATQVEIAEILHINPNIVRNIVKNELRKHILDFAKKLKEDSGDDEIYQMLKKMKVLTTEEEEKFVVKSPWKEEKKVASIISYLELLEKKFIRD